MKPARVIFLVSMLCSVAGTARARLGETRKECTARYGEAVAEVPALLENAAAVSFLLKGVQVKIEFLDNRASFISFSRRGLTPTERQTLLEVNGGPLVWNPPGEFVGRTFWTASGSGSEMARHATGWHMGDRGFLDVATDEWTKAMRAQQALQFVILTREPAATPVDGTVAPATELVKPGGNLEGF